MESTFIGMSLGCVLIKILVDNFSRTRPIPSCVVHMHSTCTFLYPKTQDAESE